MCGQMVTISTDVYGEMLWTKMNFSTWYGKLLAILIAAIVLVILFVLLGILIPIMVIAGIIIYLVRFRPRQ